MRSYHEYYYQFQHKTFEVDYKGEDLEFEVSTRPMFSWVEELADDPNIIPLFQWDAMRLYKYDGTKWVRFIDEPCTADDWWNIQASHLLTIYDNYLFADTRLKIMLEYLVGITRGSLSCVSHSLCR